MKTDDGPLLRAGGRRPSARELRAASYAFAGTSSTIRRRFTRVRVRLGVFRRSLRGRGCRSKVDHVFGVGTLQCLPRWGGEIRVLFISCQSERVGVAGRITGVDADVTGQTSMGLSQFSRKGAGSVMVGLPAVG